MALAETPYTEKTDEQKAICEMVHQFADEQIIPNAEHYDHEDSFPEPIVEQMKELGLFGVTIPEEYGGMGLDLTTYAMIVEELSRGWISISGIVNTHFIGSYLLMKFGTEEQKQKYLPKMATGEIAGRVLAVRARAAARTSRRSRPRAKKVDDDALRDQRHEDVGHQRAPGGPGVRARQDRPDRRAQAPRPDLLHRREGAGGQREHRRLRRASTSRRRSRRWATRASSRPSSCSTATAARPRTSSAARTPGLNKGFAQMMDALELGRVNVAARGVGIAQRALELALKYSQERKTFGKPIAEHQAIQFKLADMATQVDAARLLTHRAARLKDAGERSDIEAGMAKLFASEAGRFCVEECVPHPRRLRLLEGVRDRAAVPRRAAAADRRGHERDPADGDRPQAAAAPQALACARRLSA